MDDDGVDLFREPDELDDEPLEKPPPSAKVRILSVTGAKGGVGKSVLATNLAVYLASIGRRVIIVDADAAGANLHTLLGVRRARTLPTGEEPGVPRLLETPVP